MSEVASYPDDLNEWRKACLDYDEELIQNILGKINAGI